MQTLLHVHVSFPVLWGLGPYSVTITKYEAGKFIKNKEVYLEGERERIFVVKPQPGSLISSLLR